jgi:two-component system chemotaxis response regulator CheB
MTQRCIRVLVVDDSPLIREMIADALALHPDLSLAGFAADGAAAIEAIETLRPDVVTLDLQMPRMDGLATLDALLATHPVPVIVVSSLTQRSADQTLQALQRGAMDYVGKPEGAAAMRKVFGEDLPTKIRHMAGADVRRILQFRQARQQRAAAAPPPADSTMLARCAAGCVAIGISTGGPPALSQLFAALAPPLPPIVVVQHMPPAFTGPFASRLNALSSLTVKEAATGDILAPNCAYVAPGGMHLSLVRRGTNVVIKINDGDFVSGHKPSVDVMMQSTAVAYGSRCVGVIMTGMGRDGAAGCAAIRTAGGYVLGQDQATSDVYGMNKVAFVEGHVDSQAPLDALPGLITDRARRRVVATTAQPADRRLQSHI